MANELLTFLKRATWREIAVMPLLVAVLKATVRATLIESCG
jgi:hypothetical protein